MEHNTSEPSKGLGDTIAKITHALGIDKVADAIASAVGAEDCGCERRRQALNERFPYHQKSPDPIPPPIKEEDYNFTGSKKFLLLTPLTLNRNGVQHNFTQGEILDITQESLLYPFLKTLLERRNIQLYNN